MGQHHRLPDCATPCRLTPPANPCPPRPPRPDPKNLATRKSWCRPADHSCPHHPEPPQSCRNQPRDATKSLIHGFRLRGRRRLGITACAAPRHHAAMKIPRWPPNPHAESVTSDVALDFAHAMIRRFDVDWAGLGYTDRDLDELAEHLLRIIQSFVVDPGRPPRCGDELRGYMRRWVGAAIRPSAEVTSSARTRTSSRR